VTQLAESQATTTTRSGDRPGPGRHRDLRQQLQAWLFVSPAVLLVAVLLYAPFLWTAFLSFTKYDGLGNPKWTGLSNYSRFFQDDVLWVTISNTLLWVAGTIILPVGLGLFVATVTYRSRWGGLLRLPFLLPYAVSGAGVAVVWGFILQPHGALNDVLGWLHLPGGHSSLLLYRPVNTIVMIVASTWQGVGVNALLFLVGLQSIPNEPIEAARLDGASGWTMFRHIIWPLLRPLTAVVVGLAIVASLKTFDIVWVLTQGGPGRSSETLAVTMYRDTFVANEYGQGSAVAVLLTLIAGVASITYLRTQLSSRRNVSW
jgi:multiple sugar transport system permease protein